MRPPRWQPKHYQRCPTWARTHEHAEALVRYGTAPACRQGSVLNARGT
jgi:hypothetical protein